MRSSTTVPLETTSYVVETVPFGEVASQLPASALSFAKQLAGYYILDCENLDEAIAWAGRIPAHCQGMAGCVEIRPLQEFSAVPDSFRKSKAAFASVFQDQ